MFGEHVSTRFQKTNFRYGSANVGTLVCCDASNIYGMLPHYIPDKLSFERTSSCLKQFLTYSLYDLCLHPEFVEPLRQEIAEQSTNPIPSFDTMPLLDSFLKESSRLNSPESSESVSTLSFVLSYKYPSIDTPKSSFRLHLCRWNTHYCWQLGLRSPSCNGAR